MQGEIREIQRMLREISFFDEDIERIIPDGIYGEDTASSVRSFQRKNNLYETGEVDNDTWDKIVEVYEKTVGDNKREVVVRIIDESDVPITVGQSALSLYVVQAMLLALSKQFTNLTEVDITGSFDAKTQEAVEQIQIISGINPNPVVDREFLNSLSELYNTNITRNHRENSM